MSLEKLRRRQVVEQREGIVYPSLSSESMARVSEQLREIAANPEAYMDEGGAATIYRLPAGGACMKIMKAHTESQDWRLKPGNSMEQEAHFMDRLTGFAVDGTRSPYFLSTMRDADIAALLMEEIEGANLQKILQGKAELPESYSHHDFFESLERYLQALHAEKRIAHGDLEARNVMVDFKTGLPRVIDFGRSKDMVQLTPEGQARAMQDDWKKLETIEREVHSLQKRH